MDADSDGSQSALDHRHDVAERDVREVDRGVVAGSCTPCTRRVRDRHRDERRLHADQLADLGRVVSRQFDQDGLIQQGTHYMVEPRGRTVSFIGTHVGHPPYGVSSVGGWTTPLHVLHYAAPGQVSLGRVAPVSGRRRR